MKKLSMISIVLMLCSFKEPFGLSCNVKPSNPSVTLDSTHIIVCDTLTLEQFREMQAQRLTIVPYDTAYHGYATVSQEKDDIGEAGYMQIGLNNWHSKVDSICNSFSNLSKNLTCQKDAKALPYFSKITQSRDDAHRLIHKYAFIYAVVLPDLLANTTELNNFCNQLQSQLWDTEKAISTTLPGKSGTYFWQKAAGGSGTQGGGWYYPPSNNDPIDRTNCCTPTAKNVVDLNSKVGQRQ